MDIKIRKEEEKDYRIVENLTREAFWDVYRPGCNEHLVIHKLRQSPGFIRELDLVAEYDNQIIGHIAYSKGYLEKESDQQVRCIAFGPISVHPEYQKQGIGKLLIQESMDKARELGYDVVLITGSDQYYPRLGFESASKYHIYLEGMPETDEASFFMLKELKPGILRGIKGVFYFDPAFDVSEEETDSFDALFPPKKKREPREWDLN